MDDLMMLAPQIFSYQTKQGGGLGGAFGRTASREAPAVADSKLVRVDQPAMARGLFHE